jgi:glycosyltransferase involved in cell wall biosynthesis
MKNKNHSRDCKFALDARLLNGYSGIARYSRALIKYYVKHLGSTAQILLIANDPEIVQNEFPDLAIIKTNLSPFNLLHFIKFGRLLKSHRVTHYHSFFYSSHAFKPKGIKTIITVHDLMYRLIPGFFGASKFWNIFARFYYNLIVSRSIKTADLVLAVSETTKNDIYNWLKVDSVKIANGIDTDFFEKRSAQSLSRKIPERLSDIPNISGNFILYVGNRRVHKNLELLLDCYQKSGTKKYLILCGISTQTRTKALSKLNNLPDNVICFDKLSDYDLFWLYENCAAFIFPSKYEGFGLPILEASLLGATVISSTGGALKELDDLDVYFFDPYDNNALTDYITRIDSLKKDAEIPERVRARYSWEKTLSPLLPQLEKCFITS